MKIVIAGEEHSGQSPVLAGEHFESINHPSTVSLDISKTDSKKAKH
jgi:hypothetical protein